MTAQLDTRLHFCPSRGMVHDRPTALGALIRNIGSGAALTARAQLLVCLDLLQGAAPDERGTEATSMMDGKIFLAPLPVRAATVGLGFCPPTGGGSVWPCERGGEKMPPARRNIVFWIFGGGFIGSLMSFLYPVIRFLNPPAV